MPSKLCKVKLQEWFVAEVEGEVTFSSPQQLRLARRCRQEIAWVKETVFDSKRERNEKASGIIGDVRDWSLTGGEIPLDMNVMLI